MKLREVRHICTALGDRVITLLNLERAEPRPWGGLWYDERTADNFDRFCSIDKSEFRYSNVQ